MKQWCTAVTKALWPTFKEGHRIERSDVYVAKLEEGWFPGDIVMVGDAKIVDLAKARLETSAYCVRAQTSKKFNTWVTSLGLAYTSTPPNAELYVIVGNDTLVALKSSRVIVM